jgi:hypothetical protein
VAVHLGAIGLKYFEDKRIEDAERCFRAYLRLVKDSWIYRRVADEYLKMGDEDHWLATLEAYLRDSPDTGLAHARMRVDISKVLMGRGKYAKALPYAEEAAGTWAEWAMGNAADCHEGLGHWEQALTWQTRIAERYPEHAISYFAWCWRTGKGDLQAAERLAQTVVNQGADRISIATYYYLKGDREAALKWYRQSMAAQNISLIGLHAALAADDLGDKAMRDEAIDRVVVRGTRGVSATIARDLRSLPPLAKLFQQALVKGEKDTLDVAAVDRLIDADDAYGKLMLRELTGRFLLLHGDNELAKKYLVAVVRSPDASKWNYVLAWKALRHHGWDPLKLRQEEKRAD